MCIILQFSSSSLALINIFLRLILKHTRTANAVITEYDLVNLGKAHPNCLNGG
jgi:hypothetical protein